MSESSHSTIPTRLALEPLEDREVPAFGLDPTFGTGGLALNPVGQVRFVTVAVAVAAPGDALVTAGNLVGPGLYGAGGDVAVTRLTATGTADSRFGGGDGLVSFSFPTPHSVSAVANLADGKILVAGSVGPNAGSVGPADFTPPSDMFVLRLNADGTRDTSFGVNGEADVDFGASDTLNRMVVQTDGKILLAGTTATSAPGSSALARLTLARLTATGTPDTSFGTAGMVLGAVSDLTWNQGGLAVQTDGKVLVSGAANTSFGNASSASPSEMTLLRFNSNGTADTSFGTAGRAQTQYGYFPIIYANDIATLSDGRIVVGGGNDYGRGLLAWFNSSGSLLSEEQFSDPSGGLESVETVVAMPQGGVELVGLDSGLGAAAVEYHAAPGSATSLQALNPGPGYALSGGVALGTGGKLVIAEVSGGIPLFDGAPPGGALTVVRLADPGATQSATTFVRWGSQTVVPDGQAILSVTVVPLLGENAVAEGTITFREGSTVLGTVDLAKVSPSPWGGPTGANLNVVLPPGEHTITAAYSGTVRWSASSTLATFHVAQSVAVNASLSVSNSHPILGEPVVLTATLTRANAALVVANATVTFYDGDTVLGTGLTLLNGIATLSTSTLTSGTHSIRAVYSGGPGFNSAESAPVSVQVTTALASTNVVLALSNYALVVGQQTTLIAAVYSTSTGVTPRGMVTFYDGSTVLGSAAVSPNGSANFTTNLRLGAHTLRASYAGDATTVASDASPLSVTVGKAPTATGIVTGATSFTVGQPVTLTATVQPALGTAFPIGTVEFREGTTVLGSVALDGRGQAKITLTGLTAGGHVITAYYLGCSTCLGSTSGAYSVTVGAPVATMTTLATSVLNPVFGQSQTLTARVTGNAITPVGRVEFYDGTVLLGSAALDARGEASLSVVLNLGAHKLRALYVGTASFTNSSSTWLNETVTKAPTTINLTTTTVGTIQAQVRTSFAGSPIGTVTFKEGNVVLGTVAVNGAGVAVFTFFGKLAPGKHQITAVYSGSSCFLDMTSAPFTLTIAASA